MSFQAIAYRGRLAAVVTRSRFVLHDDLERRSAGDPEATFVVFMCVYARDVLTGILPGPYSDADARRFAWACTIPTELLERPGLDDTRAARALDIPVEELRAALQDRTDRDTLCLVSSSATAYEHMFDYSEAMPTSDALDHTVLSELLALHPAMLDLEELTERTGADSLRESVGRLADDGIVTRLGDRIGLTRAAVRMHHLSN